MLSLIRKLSSLCSQSYSHWIPFMMWFLLVPTLATENRFIIWIIYKLLPVINPRLMEVPGVMTDKYNFVAKYSSCLSRCCAASALFKWETLEVAMRLGLNIITEVMVIPWLNKTHFTRTFPRQITTQNKKINSETFFFPILFSSLYQIKWSLQTTIPDPIPDIFSLMFLLYSKKWEKCCWKAFFSLFWPELNRNHSD